MLAPSPAFLRYAKHTQAGVAIIMAMLTLALAAGLAAIVLTHFSASLEQVSGRHEQDQAHWLARGAIDWAKNVLSADRRTSNVDHLGEVWATKVPPTPVEEGQVSGEIQELSGHFNINTLANLDGSPNAGQLAAFERLLNLVGLSRQASGLARAAQNQIITRATPASNNPETAPKATTSSAQGPLLSIESLLNLPGYDLAMLERLRPFITAVPDVNSPLNVNTAPAEVLSAQIASLNIENARKLVLQRQKAWFLDPQDFARRFKELTGQDAPSNLSTTSRYFLATGRAKFGLASVRMEALLDRKQNWATLVWQRYL